MSIDRVTVQKVAALARLHLNEDELDSMTTEMASILAYVEQMRQVDTSAVEGVANIAGLVNVTRADEAKGILEHEAVLANAPKADQDAFLVPKAVKREGAK